MPNETNRRAIDSKKMHTTHRPSGRCTLTKNDRGDVRLGGAALVSFLGAGRRRLRGASSSSSSSPSLSRASFSLYFTFELRARSPRPTRRRPSLASPFLAGAGAAAALRRSPNSSDLNASSVAVSRLLMGLRTRAETR